MENDKGALKSSMVSIGEKLKAAREKKNLAIDQVQKQTRIYSTVLAALEEGRCDEILPVTYVKSFLKKYSGYLGLDLNAILKEYAAIHPEEAKGTSLSIPSIERSYPDIFSKFIYGLSLILLLIASVSLFTFLGRRAMTVIQHKPVRPPRAVVSKRPMVPVESTPQLSVPKQLPLNIVIKVKERVQLGVKKDGVLMFKRVMPKGAVESFTPKEILEIYVAKAEAIELVLNGKSLGSPGRGVIKDLEITRKGVKKRE
ncbi:MAG: DUF4115 domain-containing protein [Candidatus Omnitrophica bacterium]|nr:DUF4115 domain-containing protein [Candidatus Omnitrophota bacterium]